MRETNSVGNGGVLFNLGRKLVREIVTGEELVRKQ